MKAVFRKIRKFLSVVLSCSGVVSCGASAGYAVYTTHILHHATHSRGIIVDLKTIEEVIQKAIEGGWKPQQGIKT
jgi:hypothetical protein